MEYLQGLDAVVRQLTAAFKVKAEEVPGRVAALQEELRGAAKQVAELQAALAVAKSQVSMWRSLFAGVCLVWSCRVGGTMAYILEHLPVCLPPEHPLYKPSCAEHTGGMHRLSTYMDVSLTHVPSPPLQALVSQAVAAPGGGQVLVAEVSGVDPKALQEAATSLLAALGDPAAVVLGCGAGDKVNFVAAVSPQVRAAGAGGTCTQGQQQGQQLVGGTPV